MRYDQHVKDEFEWLLEKIKGVRSILEIGSYWGQSIEAFSTVAAPGAVIRCIDRVKPQAMLDTMARLNTAGFDAYARFDDSHSQESVQWAKVWAPYDFIFIDGDHSYLGAKQDFENYSVLSRMIGMHDIDHTAYGDEDGGAAVLWRQIKLVYRTEELCLHPGTMGTGIVYR